MSTTSDRTPKTVKINQRHGWQRIFGGTRTRILVWYFLLTACTTLVSILATREIFCASLRTKAEESLVREVERFQLLVNQQKRNSNQFNRNDIATLFDQFLASYVPTTNESVFALLDGQLYKSSPTSLPNLLVQNPNLVKELAQLNQTKHTRLVTPNGPIRYMAEPIATSTGTRGVLVAVYDSTPKYQTNQETIVLLIQVTMVVLVLFSWLAWITAGRVLSPLRLLTQTARSITESDMTQRIPVQGADEIAELSITFNEMLDRLQLAFASQQEFLKDASHELRTPITVIQGHLELLNYHPERQQEAIALVMDELEGMNRLVNDLLVLAKAERPDFLRLKPEELDWLTEELYFKARALANRDWRLESKGLSPVVVDRQRFTQAVMNLVQNAIRHTKEGDTITLGSSVRDGYAYFWVRDTGEGIAPEDRERIFERFVRATHQDDSSEGVGLGLAIVKAIAQAHSGWVELSSHLGVGSTFILVIPLVSPQDVAADEPDSHRRRQPSYHRLFGSRTTNSWVHYIGGKEWSRSRSDGEQ